MSQVKAYGAKASDADLKQLDIKRRELLPNDIHIEIDYCGVCHSDIHQVRNDWKNSKYPVIPGHEIIGHVVAIGKDVTKFKEGQKVGVGCMVDSCQNCEACDEGLEQFCENGMTATYNSPDEHLGGQTFGGYSEEIVVDEKFVLNVPEKLDIKGVPPLLCAGITTWSPLKQWNVQKGDKVGVVGLGGLGHMGIKFAHALGAHVVMITTSPSKSEDAERLGADEVLVSKNEEDMKKHANSFDFILNTVPVGHDVNPYLNLLKRDKTMCLVGAIEPLKGVNGGALIVKRKRLAGSLIGGIKETQEMLDFCGEHNIVSDVEMIDMQNINTAFERVVNSDVKYRFVIDMQSLKN
ncbi:cinnamyl-alcohol dehydrogenase-like protein, CAD1 family [Psychroflexus gondwanensis ACAM 44]|uniref:Cinnamyl-alcohol dehydrogenase-like protein, CAD1 family n=1 Tax=Psychroflexus gondwanensis ACAM 44 TaxID=1189619 RepID=N1WTW5_9FLAO|nr:NAD(P)-dependent alcohol dehydrogenase [Psychroflexus gondwanensis]EMY80642.1 cinnamyl-alcohol dehydrogenase-like protein, CAD1 family [Psychroflexus gondwanensis ACAM 44]